MSGENVQEQWITLSKALYIEGGTDINAEIEKTKKRLAKLQDSKKRGFLYKRCRRRVKTINGIKIRYALNGRNKEIAYEADINESEVDFDKKVRNIVSTLDKSGYNPIICRKRVKVEIGRGAKCDIK